MEPEQLLFLRVIIQAIEDLLITSTELEEVLAKHQAIAWFKGFSEDYQEVCSYVGIHPKWLRTRVLTGNKEQLKGLIHEYRKLM